MRPFIREQETMSRIWMSLMWGVWIFAFVFFAPNGGHQPSSAFFQVARATTWPRLFEWSGAWCSLKIVMFCVALYLIQDSMGTLLIRYKHKSLAKLVFFSIVVPALGLFIGIYYFIKALL
jgi:hypothetical protein